MVEQLTARLRRDPALAVEDPGAKPADHGADQQYRWRSLCRFHAALATEQVVTDAAVAHAGREAADAVWLGASLADLSAVTGKTRQAARKKWPDLGSVYRRRKWLANQVEAVHYAARLLADAAEQLTPAKGGAAYEEAIDRLVDALRRSEQAFGEQEPADAAARWRELDELIDRHVRTVLDLAAPDPADGSADFAAHGATGVLTYYDMATTSKDA
ncbi:hypothetical protein GIY23_15545 [Allosaccharopolyspora coralli]|uniref:Uncharacterized protein n=2 Tax=Allosaccharopolyspora coralli TaxID=2665642 RepID=A0A5Q3QD72_9PSEU|nr:hypothetical protein GIY23_15545 [Allosaccharopolyspora coralli]